MPELADVNLADFPGGVSLDSEVATAITVAEVAHNADLGAHPDLVVSVETNAHARMMTRAFFLG